ncbi:MAG: hypothetical protein Q4C53_07455 [Clostridia bacterium]|nr:hypothetical protein [Clostridia bacterium]
MQTTQRTHLQTHYTHYLGKVLGLGDDAVAAHLAVLDEIATAAGVKSRLGKRSFFDIETHSELNLLRNLLLKNFEYLRPPAAEQQRLLSALDDYIRFTRGTGFAEDRQKILSVSDTPMPMREDIQVNRHTFRSSAFLSAQALELAGHACELDPAHPSFLSEETRRPYMVAHRIFPVGLQGLFQADADTFANIICLCPMCRARLCHGLTADREAMANRIYELRAGRLAAAGILLPRDAFVRILSLLDYRD